MHPISSSCSAPCCCSDSYSDSGCSAYSGSCYCSLVIRVVILVLIVLFIIVRHICDLLIGNIFFSYRSSMSISHKNMPKNYGTLELNFFLHFYIISTIIIIVNRNPFMILFAPLCIIYLYSPHESHQLPPGGSLRWNYSESINIIGATVRCSHL